MNERVAARSNGTSLQSVSPDEHAFFFESNTLVKTWVRHQYVKHFIAMAIFCMVFLWVDITGDYKTKVADYITRQVDDYNCSVASTAHSSTLDLNCASLDRSTQYYSLDGSEYIAKNMACSLPGAQFYYPNSFVSTYRNNYYLQLFVNAVFPFLVTYLILESIYLGRKDCLTIIPEYAGCSHDWFPQRKEGKLQRALYCYSVGWHAITDLFSPQHTSGMQLSLDAIVYTGCILWFVAAVFLIFAFPSAHDATRCTQLTSFQMLVDNTMLLLLLVIYILSLLHHIGYYYYNLFIRVGNVEVLAGKYSKQFITLRYHSHSIWERNPVDLLATMVIFLLFCFLSLYWCLHGVVLWILNFLTCGSFNLEPYTFCASRLDKVDFPPFTWFMRPIEYPRFAEDSDTQH